MISAYARKAFRSLSFKLSLTVALIILVTTSLLSLYAYLQERRGALRNQQGELQAFSMGLATRIDRSLAGGRGLVAHLSQTRDVQEFLERQRSPQALERFQQWLDLQSRQSPELSKLFLVSSTGECLASSQRILLHSNFGYRTYFQEAMAGRNSVSDWTFGALSHLPHLYSSAPVRVGGRIAGVLVAEHPVDEVEQAIDAIGKDGRTAALINQSGITIAHSDPQYLYHTLGPLDAAALAEIRRTRQFLDRDLAQLPASRELPEALRRVQRTARPETITYRMGAAPHLAVLTPLQERDWVVSVAIPRKAVLLPVHRALERLLMIGLSTLLAGVLAAVALGRSLLGPIQKLSQAMNSFGAGDTRARAPVLNGDERGELARAFNTMADALQVHRERLEDLVADRSRDLTSSEARFRQVVDCADEWIWDFDAEGRFTYASSAVARILGYSPEELVGRVHYYDLFPGDQREGLRAQVRAAVRDGLPLRNFANAKQHKDGRVVFLETSGLPILDLEGRIQGYRGADKDISERRRAERDLQVSEEKLSKIFQMSPDAIDLVDTTRRVCLDFNQAFGNLYGYTREEFIGHPVLPPDQDPWVNLEDRTRLMARLEREGLVLGFETPQRRKDGSIFTAEMSITRLEIDGRPCHLSLTRNISDRKRAEEEKARLQALLLQAQKMESLGVLAGGVAHDMNNVLGAILGIASATLESASGPVRPALETIVKATERGSMVIKSLLGFARVNPACRETLDLNAVILEETQFLERTTLAKVRLELQLAPGLRPIQGDANTLSNAVLNLCINALDAIPEQGVLTLRTRNLEADWVELQVEDTGSGMSREVLEKAMDPFFTTKAMGKGTGLGLSMVYSTVTAHQGRIHIQSQPGQGTLVSLQFPACVPAPAPAPAPPAAVAGAAQRALRILLVDDDELIQSSIGVLLGVLGHTVSSALSGEEAMAELEAGLRPELVILDMNMPGMGGKGTLPRLRALCPDLPVLLATGRADQTALNLVQGDANVTLLAKPFGIKELQKQLGVMGLG